MALILSMESSTEVCSVALSANGNLIDYEENQDGQSHAELLTWFVESILNRNNIIAADIDAVAVSKGPGSYTGLRIGVSAAKGLCYAAGKPLIAISTLDSMALHVAANPEKYGLSKNKNTLLCPMIDARRMEIYNAIFNFEGKMLEQISAKIVDENTFNHLTATSKIVVFGNGAEKCKTILKHPNILFSGPDKASARFMAGIAEEYYIRKKFEDIAYFEPFYLKNFIATIPKNKIL